MTTGTLRSVEKTWAPPTVDTVALAYGEPQIDPVGDTSMIGSLALLLGLGGALGVLAANAVALPAREGRRFLSQMTSSPRRRGRFPRFPAFSPPSPPPTIPYELGPRDR
jgi:hypothetical protein